MVQFIKKYGISSALVGTLAGAASFAYILKFIFM